jgi:hypothetical protein
VAMPTSENAPRLEPMPGVYAYPEAAVYEPELRSELREATERGAREKLEAETEALGARGQRRGDTRRGRPPGRADRARG